MPTYALQDLSNVTGDDFSNLLFSLDDTNPDLVFLTLAERFGEVVNVKDYGALGDGSTDDTVAIENAYAAAVSASLGGAIALYFPPGVYPYVDSTLSILAGRTRIFGDAATIEFHGSGNWQVGDATTTAAFCEFVDLVFATDATASAGAPIQLFDAGRCFFRGCEWRFVNKNCISMRKAILCLYDCRSDIAQDGLSVVKADIPADIASAIFVQGGRYSASFRNEGNAMIDHSGAGRLDGVVLLGVSVSDYSTVLSSTPASGGKLSNVAVYGSFMDQMNVAFRFAPASGATLGDVDIVGNTINGSIDSEATTGALISVDLTSGAAHDALNFRVADNAFKDARNRVFEVLGGSLNSVVFSNNVASDYGRRNNAASRFAYIKGTFDYLEIADNSGRTSFVHDYEVEYDTVSITGSKVQDNTFPGAAASVSQFNSYFYHTGQYGELAATVSGGVLTQFRSTVIGASITRTAAGTFQVDYPKSVGNAGAIEPIPVVYASDRYIAAGRTSPTQYVIKTYAPGFTSLADPAAICFALTRAAA